MAVRVMLCRDRLRRDSRADSERDRDRERELRRRDTDRSADRRLDDYRPRDADGERCAYVAGCCAASAIWEQLVLMCA
jgi:hypothetical protein